MAGITEFITFLFVSDLEASHTFYSTVLGLDLVADQGDCRIYRVTETGFLGVCARADRVHDDGVIITLVANDVDGVHQRLLAASVAVESEPEHSERYGVYHAFYRDPDGHLVEIQRFDDPNWATPN